MRSYRLPLMASSSPAVLALVATLAGSGAAYAQAVNLGGANNIVADGRTKTNVEVNGSHTRITTKTVSNGTGFNSFSDFQQAAGTRVDLYVPDGAGNLLNIVHNSRVVIDGVLNGYKDGEIGGNIYFSDSHGFVVGANGVVNVGSLTVNTPTAAFLEGVVRADGSIDQLAVTQLMSGNIPISSDGIIAIAGTVNAAGGITLKGHEVSLTGGSIALDGVLIDQRTMFDSTVNSGGLVEGGALVSQGGRISIVATGKARIGGVVDVSARQGGKGGQIEVRSGGDIEIDGKARLTADGKGVEGGGGTIEVVAADTLLVEDNAFFGAHGAGSGLGGFVELSGHTAIIGAIGIDLGSDEGAAGTLLFDPWDLYIGGLPSGGGASDDYSLTGSILSAGANVLLQADNSITVVSGGVIDTRQMSGGVSTGNSGSITIEAPLITIADGAHLRADVTGPAFTAGDITLTAAAQGSALSSTATAGIVIGSLGGAGPVIAGRNITLSATATVSSGIALFDLPTAHATIAVNSGQVSATGAFTAEATAETDSGITLLPIGVIVTDVVSSVGIGGTASISAASARLTATSTVVSEISTTSLAPPSSAADGAVAVSTIDSSATVSVSGNAVLAIADALELAASNTVTSEANATPSTAAFGASVGVSIIDVTTSATIGGNATVSTGSLDVSATTTTDITVTAAAAAGGAEEPDEGSQASAFLADERFSAGTSTSDGGVSVVGGLAISDLTSTTLAQVSSTGVVTAADAVAISSATANSATVVADGSAVESSTGVGVAVGVNLAHVSNDAIVAQSIGAGSLTVSATMANADGNFFSTEATSGAGASNVGVAGSLATNLIDTQSVARIASGTTTIGGNGAVSLSAENVTESSASATPTGDGATGDTVGVGVSAAVSIIANRATAEIADGAVVTGAGDLSLGARGSFTTGTEAEAGSAGGISITPALGLSLVNNTTTARIGSGATLGAGSVSLEAIQVASTTTTASGEAAGAKAAVGAAIAIAIVNDQASAITARSLSVTNDVSFVAMGASASSLTAHASATGAAPADDEGEPEAGDSAVDDKVDTQLGTAKGKQTNAGIGDSTQQGKTSADVDNKEQRSASTSEGKVTVAAAVGVNVQTASSSAIVPDAVAITAGGTLTLRSAANASGSIEADGSAVGGDDIPPAQVGIGAAVAVNKVASSNLAQLGNAGHNLGGLTVEALKLDVAAYADDPSSVATKTDSYLASATAGAGGSKIGIAGALGLNLIDTDSSARIVAGATVTITGGGAVSLSADNRMEATAKALPVEGGGSGDKLGVGVSAAINIIANRATAEIADGATLGGAGALTLAASGNFVTGTEAEAGSSGGISITPALALSMISNTTTARLGSGGTLVAGSVSLGAVQQSTVTTSASAKAAGGTASIGASLALALVNDQVVATTGRNITTTGTGAVSFTAQGKSTGTLTAEASAAGAKEADDDGQASGEKDVDGKVDDQLSSGQTRQGQSGVGDTSQQGKTSTDVNSGASKDQRSAKTSEGKVSVAAAVGVNVTSSDVTAFVPDSVAISAGGVLTISSANTTSGKVTSDGSASGAQVGIGVAVSVNVVDKTNTAVLGNAAHSANGVTIQATQFGPTATPDVDEYETKATSGAGGSKVGVAGSLALNLINAQTSATITTGASVNAGTGGSTIFADQRMKATASALPSGTGASGSSVGVGASVALNLITDTTSATLPDNVAFTGGRGLAVSANSRLDTTTAAEAGATGGVAVDAVVALAMIDQTTTARIGSGAGLSMAGYAVSISATSGGAHEATAKGDTKGSSVGIGAAAAVIIGGGTQNGALADTSVTSASLARNVTGASLAISAASDRSYVAEATATAKGGKENTATKDSNGKASSSDTLDKTQDSQKGTDAAAQQNAGNKESTGSGGSGSKITVAAAVGVAAAQDAVRASLGAVTVSTTGAVTVSATNAVDLATSGIGAALNSSSQVGVGIGVALGIINNSTSAEIADSANIAQSGSVAVTATTTENAGAAFADRLTALAVAGASSSRVSVAGAFAVGISTSSANASIGDNAVVTSTGNVAVALDNQSRLSARSLAGSYTSGNAGVGASIATVYSDHSLAATVGDNSQITGAAISVTALNRKVDGGPSFHFTTDLDELKSQALNGTLLGAANYYAEAMGGAASTGGAAIQGSFAVMVFSDDVTASVGGGSTISATGAVKLEAESDLVAKALTGGIALGNSVGVGVSATVVVSEGTTRSLLANTASVTQSASFSNRAIASQDIDAFGVAAAGGNTAGVAGVATVIVSSNTVEALLSSGAAVNATGAVTLGASNDFSSFALAAGVGVGNTAGVGAGAAAVKVNNITRAALAAGTGAGNAVKVNAGGSFGISAAATQTATTLTVAGGAAGTAGVGAGAAVFVLGTTTEALVGAYAQIGQVTKPTALTIEASDTTDLDTVAGTLGIGGTAGVGAGAAVGVVSKTVTAAIGSNANVRATDVRVAATSAETALTTAIGLGIGGTAGLAGAVSVYSVDNTTTAQIGSSAVVLADNNVAVLASDDVDISFISGAVSGSGTAAVGAAASVALVSTTTQATIGSNASVTALGKGDAVSYVTGYNPALAGPSADFAAPTPDDYPLVTTGADNEILTAAEARRQGLRLLGLERNASPVTASARGVIVNASGDTAVRSLAVGAAVSGVAGVSISANVPIITTNIAASIGNGAKINIDNNAGAAASQSVVVAAAGDIYRIGLAGSVGGGTVGVGGGVDTAIVSPTISASIGANADVAAEGDVTVSAKGREDLVGAAAAAGVGATVGIAGGVSVFSLDAATSASIGSGASVEAGGNVAVIAEDITRTAAVAGSLSVGIAGGGVGGSIGLNLLTKRTSASIADDAEVSGRGNSANMTVYDGGTFSGTRAARGVAVLANSNESVFTLNIAGGGGLFAGVAGAVSVQLLDIATTATIGDNVTINGGNNSGANAAQDVVVVARDSTSVAAIDGGLAIGAGAIAGAVDVGVLQNTTSASIGDGSSVAAKRRIDVAALQNTSIDSLVVSAAGGIVGIAAGVSVYSIGDGIDPNSEGNSQLTSNGNVGGYVQGQLGDGTTNSVLGASSDTRVQSIGASAQASRNGLQVAGAITQSAAIPAGTSAAVGSATLNAGGAIAIRSGDTLNTNTIAGAAAAGAVGLGAGIGIVTVETTNTAQLTGNSTVTGGSVTVGASSNHTLGGNSVAGSLGLAAAAQASLMLLTDNSTTKALIAGTDVLASGAVVVSAALQRSGSADAKGGAVAGAAAVGVSYAAVNFGGSVTAALGQIGGKGASIGTSGARAGSVSVTASSDDDVEASAVAVSGGIGVAALGSLAESTAAANVSTTIDKATIYASGAVAIGGQSAGTAASDAKGWALAGIVAAGGSVAHADVDETVATHVFGGTLIDAGSIALSAAVAPGSAPAVTATASGSSGAFVGLTATEAAATNGSSASTLAEASTLRATGNILVAADTTTSQNANVSGLAVGIIAAGANVSRATSNTTTIARLLDLVSVQGGGVQLSATGTDSNTANATSGSGGLVAGAAADAITSSTSTTRAAIDTSAPAKKYLVAAISGTVGVSAAHTASFAGKVNSTQASVVGASGSTLTHGVNSIVDAHLSDDAYVRAANLALGASNLVRNYYIGENAGNTASFNGDNAGWNVDSGSGGLVNLPAGSSTAAIIQNTNASIGENADIHLLAPASGVSSLTMEAYNDAIVHQKGKLDSGGAIALADTSVIISVLANATVGVGDDSAVIVDIGDIAMAAWSEADLEARAAATTYGLAGAPSGKAYATFTTTNLARIGTNALVEASKGIEPTDGTMPTHGTVDISAGAGLVGQLAGISVTTTVDLFNKTAIPISTTPDARSNVASNASVLVADSGSSGDYGVMAAGDITLRASRGNIDASAVGTGKDIYLEALAAAASAISNVFGGGDVTFEHHGGSTNVSGAGNVTVNGLVATGIRRHQTVTFSYTENCDTLTSACVIAVGDIPYTITGPNPVGTEILARLTELRQLLAQYNSDPVAKGAYQAEINFLEKKLVALGLGEFVGGVFVPGAYAGPSPKDVALAAVAQSQADIGTVTNALANTTGGVVVVDTVQLGDAFNNTFADGTYGIEANATLVQTSISQMSKHANLYANNAGYKTEYDGLAGLVTAGKAAATQVDTLTGQNATLQGEIDTLTAGLATKQAELGAALIANNNATVVTLTSQIAADKGSIATKLTQIKSNNLTIATQSALASSKATDLQTALNSLLGQARDTGNSGDNTRYTTLTASSSDPAQAASNGALTKIGRAISDFSYSYVDGGNTINVTQPGLTTNNSSLQAFLTTSNGVIDGLNAATSGAGTIGGNNSLDQYILLLNNLTSQFATNTQTAASASSSSGTPMAFTIDVADTLARLGNISVVADNLVGTGHLEAPGDAKINVTNNTANTLRLGNLIIPSYDAGRVRLNGVMVTDNASINALNASASANFASVTTALSSSRPNVTILSNYNGESLSYYDPTSLDTRYNKAHIAPDIILSSGKTIDNLTGAVNLTSASGNIYINGTINAGSVNILAKNGDFVSSYVNGFNHIGGDPASFNSPTRAGEAGKGITANGAVSIAARYLNINSTIQSGIADWTLNLDGTPLLTTTDAGSIGVAQSLIDAKIAQYTAAMTLGVTNKTGTGTPDFLIDLGGGVYLNMAPAGVSAADLKAKVQAYLNGLASGTPDPLADVALTAGGTVRLNIKDFLSPDITGRLEFSVTTANTYLAANTSQRGVYGVVTPTSNIGVAYDARNVRYVVDGTSVRGGYIQLYGQIMNTASSGGQLNVLDGFGTINITNTGNIPVVLQTLNAGDDATGTGRGTAGVIDIMDVRGVNTSNPASPVVSVRHTVYTRDYDPTLSAAGVVKIAQQDGTIDNLTGNFIGSGAVTVTDGGNRTATYTTAPNQRYVWTTGQYFDNTTNVSVKQTQLFGSSSLTVSESTHFEGVDGPHTLNSYRLADGTYVTLAVTQTGNSGVINTNRGIVLVSNPATVGNDTLTGFDLITSTYAYMNSQTGPTETGRRRDCNWWTLCIASNVTIYYTINQKYTVVSTNSLRANNPIAINFIGSDTGAINVRSGNDVVLLGNVTAANGDVTICAGGTDCNALSGTGSIVQGNLAAQVTGKNVTLKAADSVGGVTYAGAPGAPLEAAIAVSLRGGKLNAAAADGNVSIGSRGDLRIGTVTAAGSVVAGKGAVNLVASGSITAADSSSLIQAPRVSLTALSGNIGSTATGQQLLVNTGFSADPSLRRFGDPALDNTLDPNPYLGLSATAGGDIGIRSTGWSGNADGTMLVDKVLSIGGNVRLSSTGHILDNNPVETIDSRTYAQLLSFWDSLGLTEGTANAQKQQATIAAFENATNQQYQQYWQIRRGQSDGGAAYDAAYEFVVPAGSPLFNALTRQFDADVRAANPDYTDPQVAAAVTQRIADYEATQTNLYRDLNGQVGGLTASYDSAFKFVASDDQKAALTHRATWTERELAFSLSAGALKTITATNPVIKDPNVAGRTVTIEAAKGVGETIGAGTAAPGVRIAGDLAPSALTIAQKVALAAAERSDIVLNILYNGSVVDVPAGTDFNALTATQQAALIAAAGDGFNPADITITILSKRPLNFNATAGLNVTVTDAPSATPDTGIAYLASRAGALLGQISVQGETRIKTIGNIGKAATGSVSTGNLILESAQGGIGTAAAPLPLALLGGSTFTARAQNGVFVNLSGDAHIDTVYSPSDIVINASGSLFSSHDDDLINILGSNVTLTASAGAIGTATRGLNVGNSIGGGITASAQGLISLYGPAQNQFVLNSITSSAGSVRIGSGGSVLGSADASIPAHITAISAGATVTITAALGIGDRTPANTALGTAASAAPNPIRILGSTVTLASTQQGDIYAHLASDPVTVTARAADGSIYLTAAGDFHGALLEALKGTVSVEAEGDLTIDILRALRVVFDAGGTLKLGNIEVAEEVELRASVLEAKITQVPSGPNPLRVTLTGHRGSVGTSAKVEIDSPAGVVIPTLRFIDSQIVTTALSVKILDAYVPGSLWLDTPLTDVFFNDRTPMPQGPGNVQIYAPNFAFTLDLEGNHVTTNGYVVRYDASTRVTEVIDGIKYEGASLVRDTVRLMYRDETTNGFGYVIVNMDHSNQDEPLPEGTKFVVIDGVAYPVIAPADGPAVKLSQLN